MYNYKLYCHILKSDGRKYFGITRQSLKDRWQNGKGYKNSDYFLHAIAKYGWDSFKHIVITDGLTEEQACELEIKLIQYYDTTNETKGFNISPGGNIPNYKSISKVVSKYTLNGDYIETFDSIIEAGNCVGVCYQDLRYALRKENHTAGGFQWALGDSKANIGSVSDKVRKKPVAQYDLDNNFIACYPTLMTAERATGISNGQISRCCRHIKDSIDGYRWEYYYDYTGKIKCWVSPKSTHQSNIA